MKFGKINIIDLDAVIAYGSAHYSHEVRTKNGTVSLGGIAYLLEILATFYEMQGNNIIFCRDLNDPDLEYDLMSMRDLSAKVQYKICVNKLSAAKVRMVVCKTKEEFNEKFYKAISKAVQQYMFVNIYSRDMALTLPWVYTNKVIVINDSAYSLDTPGEEMKYVNQNVNLFEMKSLLAPVIKDKIALHTFLTMYYRFLVTVTKGNPEQARLLVETNTLFEPNKLFVSKLPSAFSEHIPRLVASIEKEKNWFENNDFELGDTSSINQRGMEKFLKMVQFPLIAEYLHLSHDVKLSVNDREYIYSKFDEMLGKEVYDDLSLDTSFFTTGDNIKLGADKGVLYEDHSEEIQDLLTARKPSSETIEYRDSHGNIIEDQSSLTDSELDDEIASFISDMY